MSTDEKPLLPGERALIQAQEEIQQALRKFAAETGLLVTGIDLFEVLGGEPVIILQIGSPHRRYL